MHVQVGQSCPLDALPAARLAPAFEAPPHGRRRAVFARQVLPLTAGNEDIQDAVEGPAVISAGAPSARGRWWMISETGRRRVSARARWMASA
jgi:hypothetical protein